MLKEKQRRRQRLQRRVGRAAAAMAEVRAEPLWNIPNIPAAQISMLGSITGPTSRRSPHAPLSASR